MYTINFWPILIASIVAFALGALWYSPVLFGKEWMALTKMTDKDISDAKSKGMFKLYLGQFIMTIITFIVLGFTISALGANGQNGAMIGFLAWLGFVLPTGVSAYSWENMPLKLIAINTVCILLTLVIGGAIIGAWQ